MAKGQKYTDEIKERAIAEYATCGNVKEVARKLKLPYSTVRGWLDNTDRDELDKVRDEKKKEFIARAWEVVINGTKLENRRIKSALEKEAEFEKIIEDITNMDPKEVPENIKAMIIPKLRMLQVQDLKSIAVAVGTMYDKHELASGGVTERSESGVVILPEIKSES